MSYDSDLSNYVYGIVESYRKAYQSDICESALIQLDKELPVDDAFIDSLKSDFSPPVLSSDDDWAIAYEYRNSGDVQEIWDDYCQDNDGRDLDSNIEAWTECVFRYLYNDELVSGVLLAFEKHQSYLEEWLGETDEGDEDEVDEVKARMILLEQYKREFEDEYVS